MHPMERAITETLKLNPGDDIMFSFKSAAVMPLKEGGIAPAFVNAKFKGVVSEGDKVVLLIDFPGAGNTVVHSALDMDMVAQVGVRSDIAMLA